jgi:hypothetical protein
MLLLVSRWEGKHRQKPQAERFFHGMCFGVPVAGKSVNAGRVVSSSSIHISDLISSENEIAGDR